GHVARRFDAQTDLATIYVNDGYADVIADVDLFTQFAAQDQHFATLLRARPKRFAGEFYTMKPGEMGRLFPFYPSRLRNLGGKFDPKGRADGPLGPGLSSGLETAGCCDDTRQAGFPGRAGPRRETG